MPKSPVGIGNASNHQKSSPKFWNISARLALIYSADGACPYLANTFPYPRRMFPQGVILQCKSVSSRPSMTILKALFVSCVTS